MWTSATTAASFAPLLRRTSTVGEWGRSGPRLVFTIFSCPPGGPVNDRRNASNNSGKGIIAKKFKKFTNKFVHEKDLNKRPSDLEIRQKDLPKNQATLGERLGRDAENLFFQRDPHHGYIAKGRHVDFSTEVIEQIKYELKTNPKDLVKHSFSVLREEVVKWSEEAKDAMNLNEHIQSTPIRAGDTRKEWGFQSELDLDQWVLTVDSDWGEGYSSAELSLNSSGTAALFRGNLSTRIPADGRTQYAGYANISSVNKRKSFARLMILHHWQDYTHLTMNVRGDGRKYMLNLKILREYDVTWDDRYHFPLYTRGGPYWQRVKIPFSKFYLGHKGMIQDKQAAFPGHMAVGMGITLKDRITGPFQLEIKDVSLQYDPNGDDEEFAYEMYKVPDFWSHH